MKEISIQELKSNLSAAVAEAESGNIIIITRHNEPVAKLTAAGAENIFRGKDVGKGTIRPAFKGPIRIPYLDILKEDRADR